VVWLTIVLELDTVLADTLPNAEPPVMLVISLGFMLSVVMPAAEDNGGAITVDIHCQHLLDHVYENQNVRTHKAWPLD
jgi:hypothetical protein